MGDEWLDIVYSGFWDYPCAFITRFDGNTYVFRRGYFDEGLDDYPSEYEVMIDNGIDFYALEKNFSIEDSGTIVGKIDIREIAFDPTHREKINAKVFDLLGLKEGSFIDQ